MQTLKIWVSVGFQRLHLMPVIPERGCCCISYPALQQEQTQPLQHPACCVAGRPELHWRPLVDQHLDENADNATDAQSGHASVW